MYEGQAAQMSRPDTVTLRVTSPCEHGKHHEITELIEGADVHHPRVPGLQKGFPAYTR